MSESGHRAAPTLTDVARLAGVSLATASRVLNAGHRTVGVTLRDRVLDAARSVNYTPNLAARAVAQGATATIALVVTNLTDPYFSAIASGVVATADERGLIVNVAVSLGDPEREAALIPVLRGQRPRCIIIVGSRRDGDAWALAASELGEHLTRYAEGGGRVSFVSQPVEPFSSLDIRNRDGAAALADELLGLGYRRAAILSGPGDLLTARDRVAGFAARFADAGVSIPEALRIASPFTRDGGHEAAKALHLLGLADVDVIFAVSDVMAVGAMAYLRGAGVSLPGDVAIAGFDDISTLRDVSPALTTVSLPLKDIGRRALELALSDEAADAGFLTVTGEVVIRESTPERESLREGPARSDRLGRSRGSPGL